MAVHWDVDCKRGGDLHMFYPEDLVIKAELNGRHHAPDVEDMINSILKYGQLQPILVRQEDGKPVVIAGFSRYTAISEINKRKLADEPMRITCTYVRCNESDGYARNWHENHARKETTAMDDAHYFAQLEQRGATVDEIAAKLNLTAQFVKDRLSLNEVEPEVQAAVSAGKVSLTAAKRLKKLTAEQQREKIKGNGHGKLTAKAVTVTDDKPSKPNLKAVREFIFEHTGPAYSKEVIAFCDELLAFMDGKQ